MLAMQNNKLQLIFVALILTSLMLSGCGGSDDDDSTVEPDSFSGLWQNEFSGCGTNCHNPSAADGTEDGPDMSTQALFYANLVNKNVTDDYPNWIRGSDCDNTPFINPNNPAKSTLLSGLVQSYADDIVASGDCSTSSFNIHEVNQVSLSNSANLVDWINQGAPNN